MYFATMLYCFVGPILISLSYLGNSMGVLVTYYGSFSGSVQNLLLRAIFTFNILATTTSIAWPIMSCWGLKNWTKWWTSLPWNRYIAIFHFPLYKSFINTSFLISFLICLDRYIAISMPFRYGELSKLRHARVAIGVAYFLSLLIYSPTTLWFKINSKYGIEYSLNESSYIIHHNLTLVKSLQSTMIFPDLIYSGLVSKDDKHKFIYAWTGYEILREILSTLLPFLLMVVMSYHTIRDIKKVRNAFTTTPTINRSDVTLSGSPRSRKTGDPSSRTVDIPIKAKRHSNVNRLFIINKVSKCRVSSSQFNLNAIPQIRREGCLRKYTLDLNQGIPRRSGRLDIDHRNKAMLCTLILQFMIFILPVSILQMFYDLLSHRLKASTMDNLKAIANINEIQYLTWYFYLSILFSNRYRLEFQKVVRTLRGKIRIIYRTLLIRYQHIFSKCLRNCSS